MLESRNSLETSTTREHDRSGYVTVLQAVALRPRCFNSNLAILNAVVLLFSAIRCVSVNGARDDILKDDKPRSIMKRRELETRDQMLHPSADNQLIEQRQYHRTQSNVSNKVGFANLYETVQRLKETRPRKKSSDAFQRKERRDRRSRHHSSSRHHGSHGWENGYSSERRIVSVPPPQRIIYQESKRSMTNDELDKVVREAYEAADEARREHYRMFRVINAFVFVCVHAP
ncbi:hypothetical protein OSTOST_25652 [Ostertagia ostertagi]